MKHLERNKYIWINKKRDETNEERERKQVIKKNGTDAKENKQVRNKEIKQISKKERTRSETMKEKEKK